MKYLLDIRNCQKPKWYPENCPDLIPLETGRHLLDFDIVEKEMPIEWQEKTNEVFEGVERAPVGIARSSFPVGAILIPVSE